MAATWNKEKFSNLIHIKHGFAFKGDYFCDSPTTSILLTPGNFSIGGGFQSAKTKYYNGPIPQEYVLKNGDLIVTMTDLSKKGDTLGYPAIVPDNPNFKYLHNQRIGLIEKKKNNIDLKFLFYLMRTHAYQKFVVGSASGATVKHTSPNKICDYETSIPDLPTQTRIASVLSAYDDLIENNEKRIKALEEMAQLLYTEWFVKYKFPGHEKVKMVESGTEYGKIPKGWEVKGFYDVVDNLDSKRKPVSSMKRQQIQGEYPYYGAAKIIDYINDYIFDGKYLLIAEDGSVITLDGKPVLQFVNEKFWVSNHAHIVQGNILSTEILYLRLSRFNIKPLITGSAQPKITKDNLSRVLFIVPEDKIKNAFTNIVSGYFDEIFNMQNQNKSLSQSRDLLIPQLVTGKKELKS